MYLMYVDESGDTGVGASQTSHFILSGIVVHESHWREWIGHLKSLRANLRDFYGLPVRNEIHASEYLRKPLVGIQKHQRLAILRNVLDEVAQRDYLSVTNVVVDKTTKLPNYDVFESAWKILFQRFENTLQFGNFPGKHRNDHGLIFTDATSGEKLTSLMRKMAVYTHVPFGSGQGSRNLKVTKIIEDPHEKDSAHSLPIQMCDVCAYFLQQYYSPNGYVRKKRAHNYFERLKPVLNLKASNQHVLGIVEI